MKLLGTIRAGDVFAGAVNLPDASYQDIRQTVRIALLDDEGKFGFVVYPKRPGFQQDYYAFLGGGLNKGETHIEALHRETLEEVGCRIKDILELGVIKEFGIDQTGQAAESHCYFARVDGEKGEPSYDEKEAEGGARPVWMTLPEATAIYEKQLPGFSKHRARIIFDELTRHPGLLFSTHMNNDTTNKPNVLMAVVAYIIFFIPLLTESKSDKFVKYHVKQSLALLILAIGGNMVLGAIPFFGWLAMLPFNLVIVILFIMGVLNALGGTEKRLPLIGKMGEGFTF